MKVIDSTQKPKLTPDQRQVKRQQYLEWVRTHGLRQLNTTTAFLSPKRGFTPVFPKPDHHIHFSVGFKDHPDGPVAKLNGSTVFIQFGLEQQMLTLLTNARLELSNVNQPGANFLVARVEGIWGRDGSNVIVLKYEFGDESHYSPAAGGWKPEFLPGRGEFLSREGVKASGVVVWSTGESTDGVALRVANYIEKIGIPNVSLIQRGAAKASHQTQNEIGILQNSIGPLQEQVRTLTEEVARLARENATLRSQSVGPK